jgi:SNF2 family DNA or RNA helicase
MKKKGCILADDMGLGKTCQVSAFLMQMHINNHIENPNHDAIHVMIYPPNSLLHYWQDEFEQWRKHHTKEL